MSSNYLDLTLVNNKKEAILTLKTSRTSQGSSKGESGCSTAETSERIAKLVSPEKLGYLKEQSWEQFMNSVKNSVHQDSSGNQSTSGMIMLNKSSSKVAFQTASQQSLKKGSALKQLKNNLMNLVEDLNSSEKMRESSKNATNSTLYSTMEFSGV